MSFRAPEEFRWTDAPDRWASTAEYGNNGAFRIPSPEPGWLLCVVASDGEGWEHVSVHAAAMTGKERARTPTWKEMAYVKRLFWGPGDVVMQLYPRQAEYVNHHPYTLHWWRPMKQEIPTPPSILVGPPTPASAPSDPGRE